jgi:hypothetical protein
VLKDGCAAWVKTGAKAGLTFYLTPLIWALWQAVQLDEAMSTIDEAEELIAARAERCFEAEICRLRGEVLMAQDPGRESEAETLFRKSLSIAHRQGTRAWELRAAQGLGCILVRSGRVEEACTTLKPVVDWFHEGLDTIDLRDARHLLATWQSNDTRAR